MSFNKSMTKQTALLRFMITSLLLLLTSLAALLGSPQANAASAISPLGVSIVPPIQFPSDEFTITGLRMSVLWGRHRDVYGLDFGAVGNITEQDFTGVGLSGIFNITHGTTRAIGLQGAGILNMNTQKTAVYGLQVAGGLNINTAESRIVGLQAALLGNLSPNTTIYGAQIGLYNRAQEVYGFQIGLVNFTKNLHGVQIGLVNFNETGIFGVSPFLNVGF